MQFALRKFITAGAKPYHAEFQCDLSAYDYAGARIPQPVTAVFDAQTDGDEVQITLRAKASVCPMSNRIRYAPVSMYRLKPCSASRSSRQAVFSARTVSFLLSPAFSYGNDSRINTGCLSAAM